MTLYNENNLSKTKILSKSMLFFLITFITSFLLFYYLLSDGQYFYPAVSTSILISLYVSYSYIIRERRVFYNKDGILHIINFEASDFFSFQEKHSNSSDIDLNSFDYESIFIVKDKLKEKRIGRVALVKLIGDGFRITVKKGVVYKHIQRDVKIKIYLDTKNVKERELIKFLENM